jgi:Ser/Thr protein kinase RdoA (MazF antagonist)
MTETAAPPFSGLTPHLILNALESVGLCPDGRLMALNSYENRVYQAGLERDEPAGPSSVVAKFYRPARWGDEAILEELGFTAELAQREIPVVPALSLGEGGMLHRYGGFRFAVFPTRGGRAPELGDPATLEWIGRFIGRIHAVGATADFSARPELNLKTFGEEPAAYLRSSGLVPVDLVLVYESVIAMALDGVRRCFERAGDVRRLRLHGDCHVGNILWTDDGPHFVDFDDCRMGPAIQDLWMLLAGEREERAGQMADVLAGYEMFCEFDSRELYLEEALRTLRLIHYSAWLAKRWEDPAFPAAFPWFNTQRYWQDRILELREQIARMDEPPLWSS